MRITILLKGSKKKPTLKIRKMNFLDPKMKRPRINKNEGKRKTTELIKVPV
ncbi:hypothetical protein AQPE_3993 [Aquipluma nitroreducens]|uniref:Uncharacterized protein n=1 Tax=Aquipluma nitroreducens TaxID=2010828 RepID=A0A5K7SE90_9BACT|nr:hypothetical protein AQPE_3993 [Aquipluma nitroreducens]